jgi:hypothetical protein
VCAGSTNERLRPPSVADEANRSHVPDLTLLFFDPAKVIPEAAKTVTSGRRFTPSDTGYRAL